MELYFLLKADHDPRNAAYIVTQGPLPHTVPDLWQMVWEQGCVVLVMLTRLGEPDAPLCHRYWPEDGSEIYHIYEVSGAFYRNVNVQGSSNAFDFVGNSELPAILMEKHLTLKK